MSHGLSGWELFTWQGDASHRSWVSREAEQASTGGKKQNTASESERALTEERGEEISAALKTGDR